jgi:two-component system sensor histidine kinase EvgS
VQASNHSQSARSGSGLGLVISRSLCEMMGGTLRLDSAPGEGTQVEVSLELPLLAALAQTPTPPQAVVAAACSLSVLVVDDHPVNRLLLCWQLSELGHRTVDTENGDEGLERWRTQAFDVVITDCNMPRRNGYQLAQALREEEAIAGRKPCLILGFTANAQAEERTRCLKAGMDECLFKPIRLHDLAQALTAASHCDIAAASSAMPALAEIDLSALEQMAGNDRGLIEHLRKEVLNSLHLDLQRLDMLQQEQDRAGLRELAHHIKGGAQMVGAARVVAACIELEQACREAHAAPLGMASDTLREAMAGLAQRLQS